MGRNKNRHTKDRLFISVSEHRDEWGGSKRRKLVQVPKLPFNYCALSLTPCKNPVCAPDGTVFDLLQIVPYLQKHKVHPVTRQPLTAKELVKLQFSQNSEGDFQCPVTLKTLNEHSHIVAIRNTGHVYSFEAVDELNRKQRNWFDLLTGEPFTSNDIIVLQNPKAVKPIVEVRAEALPLERKKTVLEDEGLKHDRFTTGLTAASFTSTSLDPQPVNRLRPVTDNEMRKLVYTEVRRGHLKGRVVLTTSHGTLRLTLHCDVAPMTCENFLGLATEGYYNDCIFHRSVPGFILQGGDPTATGTGGKNIFGTQYFRDEFHPSLRHSKRGVLSMANSGPNTNRSQFFLTYRACPHLDNKHTVFGEVEGDSTALDIVEQLEVDSKDRIKHTQVQIINIEVIDNPFVKESFTAVPVPVVLKSALEALYERPRKQRSEFDFNHWS
jgi:peptidyl-prolyl cis-trans isomerase-like protein 2